MLRNRKYKSGTAWCLWRWTDVDSEYITRLHVVKTPWFAICLHWINKPDAEPYLHDHPVSFLSLILRGGYQERRCRRWMYGYYEDRPMRRWCNLILASPDDVHRIERVLPKTLTLVFMGPKTREWGFHTPDGWVHWKDYYAVQRAAKGGQQ
jgi:hypothetical protein